MQERTIEDRLREEYFDLLPDIRRVAWQLEAEIRYHTLPILHSLKPYEQLIVKSRVKECESALKTLKKLRSGNDRAKNEGRTLDPNRPGDYSMLNLPDLAGVRVLAFPNSILNEVDQALGSHFHGWIPKPLKDDNGAILGPKYYGYCNQASAKVRGEYQIVPMLLGLFWDVEHSAMYKFDAAAEFEEMKKHRAEVYRALAHFAAGIESFVQDYTEPSSGIA